MNKKRRSCPTGASNGLSLYKSLLVVGLVLACIGLGLKLDGNDTLSTEKAETVVKPEVGYGENLMAVKTNKSFAEVTKSYKAMDMSFNPSYHIPNWVSWELTADETGGTVARSNKFSSDPDVEGSAHTSDYRNSGYDRGHMAPAGDMRWDKEAMEQTFYMTNICPQDKSLNTGSWKNLEEKCRQWAEADSAIYIVCGPIIDENPIEYIGETQVYVPRRFFKVIISPYANPARGIGFIMPNGKVKGGMQACAVTIDSVEAVTGHDFFYALPDDVESDVESQCNFHYWSTHKKKRK